MRAPRVFATLAICVAAVVSLGAATSAYGAYGITSFDGAIGANGVGDVSFTQAGGHPYAVSTTVAFSTDNDPIYGDPWPVEPVKDVLVDVPPGLVGNPQAVAQCSLDDLLGQDPNLGNPIVRCSPASQVGTATVTLVALCIAGSCLALPSQVPVYSMVPPPGVPARFAMNISGTVVILDAQLRSHSDYGLSVNVMNVSEALPVLATSLTFWGVPAASLHDAERTCPVLGNPTGCAAGVAPKAFITLPTSCAGPQTTTVHTDSWFHPGDFKTASFVSHLTPSEGGAAQGVTGCDQVPFDPTFDAQPDSKASPGPSGWTFDLRIPQDDITNPDTIAQSHLKKATVTLPEGVRVSASAADGLGACSPAQIALKSSADPTCPNASKVGTMTIDTPLLEEQLTGSVYLATPHDNPSKSLVAIYLVAKGPGLIIKLPGSISLDKATGRISTTFDNNPQLPFSHLHLEFFGGPRAALSNPARCGAYTTGATLTSWSGKTVTTSSSFTTSHDGKGAPCPSPQFKPEFSAGTMTPDNLVPSGGSHSQFVMNLSRSDDDEEIGAITSVALPDGLLATIANVPLCAPAKVAAGTCGEASRIGSVTTTAGPGPNPFAVHGRVYLGGKYKGAPFSLSIVVPAIAGPFDLGTVVVRATLDVDPYTAKAQVVADPLPTALQGIPLQVRTISVLLDRKKFIVNPTSCNPMRIAATAVSTAGTIARLGSRFKVVDCASLPFAPRMQLQIGSKGHTGNGSSTPLVTKLTQPRGQAGMQSVSVTLPSMLTARLDVINHFCTQQEFDAGHCEDARAGSAMAVTPLLKHALRGGAYFVKDADQPAGSLPNLVIALRGQVDFNLVGAIKVLHGSQLSTRFGTVPDVPVKSFTLKLFGGKHASLAVAANLCTARSRRQLASLAFRGQNGKLETVDQRLRVRGCGKRAHR